MITEKTKLLDKFYEFSGLTNIEILMITFIGIVFHIISQNYFEALLLFISIIIQYNVIKMGNKNANELHYIIGLSSDKVLLKKLNNKLTYLKLSKHISNILIILSLVYPVIKHLI